MKNIKYQIDKQVFDAYTINCTIMNNLEKFVNRYNLNSPTIKNKISEDKKFIYLLHNNFDEVIFSCDHIFSTLSPKNRKNFFVKNFKAFINPIKTLLLSNIIHTDFSIDIFNAVNCAVKLIEFDTEVNNFSKNIFDMFSENLEKDNNQTIQYLKSHPMFLSQDIKIVYRTLYELKNEYKIQTDVLCNTIEKTPYLFSNSNVIPNIYILKKTFKYSTAELNHLLNNDINILLAPTNQIKTNLTDFIKQLVLDDAKTVSIVKSYPQVLLIPKKVLFVVSRKIMRTFSISEKQFSQMLGTCPQILSLSPDTIEKFFNALTKDKLFVKGDLKDILLMCPYILLIKPTTIIKKMRDICSVFCIETKKEATRFVWKCPEILIISDIEKYIKPLEDVGLNRRYLKIAPVVLREQTIVTIIKFLFLHAFGLEYDLDMVISQSTNMITSKLKFLNLNNHPLKDAVIDNNKFFVKYKTTLTSIQEKYPIDKDEIFNILKLACDKCNAPHLLSKYFSFFFSSYITDINFMLSNINDQISNKLKIKKLLSLIGLSNQRAEIIAKQLEKTVTFSNCLMIMNILYSFGFSREEIINLILKKPTYLACDIKFFKDYLTELKIKNKIRR